MQSRSAEISAISTTTAAGRHRTRRTKNTAINAPKRRAIDVRRPDETGLTLREVQAVDEAGDQRRHDVHVIKPRGGEEG